MLSTILDHCSDFGCGRARWPDLHYTRTGAYGPGGGVWSPPDHHRVLVLNGQGSSAQGSFGEGLWAQPFGGLAGARPGGGDLHEDRKAIRATRGVVENGVC